MTLLKPLNINNDIKIKLKGPLPGYLTSQRPGAHGASLSYYDAYTIIDVLNSTFNYLWSFEIEKAWVEPSVNWEKTGYKGEPPQSIPQGPVAHVIGKLIIPMETDKGEIIYITKASNGSKEIVGNQASQADAFKVAQTDAIKKAASLLGIAGELYRKDKGIYYFEQIFYEGLWTEEAREMHKDDLNFINQYVASSGLTESQLNDIMINATNGRYSGYIQLCPDNIKIVASYIREKTKS